MKHEIDMGGENNKDEKPYRYVVDGETICSFDEEWQALQYFDEDKAAVQSCATNEGFNFKREVLDDYSSHRTVVLASDFLVPAEPSRPKFVRNDRNKLHSIVGYAIGTLEGVAIQVTDIELRERVHSAISSIRKQLRENE